METVIFINDFKPLMMTNVGRNMQCGVEEHLNRL
jgi:hypothetical protein